MKGSLGGGRQQSLRLDVSSGSAGARRRLQQGRRRQSRQTVENGKRPMENKLTNTLRNKATNQNKEIEKQRKLQELLTLEQQLNFR